MKKIIIVLMLCFVGCQQNPEVEYNAALDEVNNSIDEAMKAEAKLSDGSYEDDLARHEKVLALKLKKYQELAGKYPEHKPLYELLDKSLMEQAEVKAKLAQEKDKRENDGFDN